MPPNPSAIQPGSVLAGRFLVERTLGAGAMGVVYGTRDMADDDARVAVKLVHAHQAQDAAYVKRFLREARALQQLDSPNIVGIVSFGVLRWQDGKWRAAVEATEAIDNGADPVASMGDGILYLAMEWLDGQPMSAWLGADTPLSAKQLIGLSIGIADALVAAHAAGMVHRDVKPDNVLVTEHRGILRAWLIDFGAVKGMDGNLGESLTHGFVVGTPAYMSPEQARGEPVTWHCDVWALGVTLHKALSGKLPYEATTIARVLMAIGREPPAQLTVSGLTIPASAQCVAAVNRLLAWHQPDRVQSPDEVCDLLRALPEADDVPPRLPRSASAPLRPHAKSTGAEPIRTLELPPVQRPTERDAHHAAPTLAMAPLSQADALYASFHAAETLAIEPIARPAATAPALSAPALPGRRPTPAREAPPESAAPDATVPMPAIARDDDEMPTTMMAPQLRVPAAAHVSLSALAPAALPEAVATPGSNGLKWLWIGAAAVAIAVLAWVAAR